MFIHCMTEISLGYTWQIVHVQNRNYRNLKHFQYSKGLDGFVNFYNKSIFLKGNHLFNFKVNQMLLGNLLTSQTWQFYLSTLYLFRILLVTAFHSFYLNFSHANGNVIAVFKQCWLVQSDPKQNSSLIQGETIENTCMISVNTISHILKDCFFNVIG